MLPLSLQDQNDDSPDCEWDQKNRNTIAGNYNNSQPERQSALEQICETAASHEQDNDPGPYERAVDTPAGQLATRRRAKDNGNCYPHDIKNNVALPHRLPSWFIDSHVFGSGNSTILVSE
jgi:hypothetical protein